MVVWVFAGGGEAEVEGLIKLLSPNVAAGLFLQAIARHANLGSSCLLLINLPRYFSKFHENCHINARLVSRLG